MAGGDGSTQSLEEHFGVLRAQLEQSGTLGERIRSAISEIESIVRFMYANLLLVHQSRPTPELLEKAKSRIDVLKEQYTSNLLKFLEGVLGNTIGTMVIGGVRRKL